MPNLVDEYKPFFLESEAKLQTLQKLSTYIRVSYKFVLKSVKTLNRIFWAIEYWFKALECQIQSTNTKPFFWKTFSLYWSFRSICFEVCQRLKLNLLGDLILAQGFRMPNLVDEYKNHFLGKRDNPWNSSKTFSLYWSCL